VNDRSLLNIAFLTICLVAMVTIAALAVLTVGEAAIRSPIASTGRLGDGVFICDDRDDYTWCQPATEPNTAVGIPWVS